MASTLWSSWRGTTLKASWLRLSLPSLPRTYGNVWHMGEYPEEYENGEFEKAPGWLAGFKGAKAGIAMRAQPRLKTPSYAQGYAPPPPSTGSTVGGSTRL